MEEPLLLLDLTKGKGNRDGLVQQIVTYVRDGHTITRKQWVRSEFADHARKNEDEKKETMLKEQERKENKHKREIAEQQEKQAHADKRAYKKAKEEESKATGHGHARAHKPDDAEKIKAKMKKLDKKDDKKKHEDDKKKKKDKKDKHSSYGQSDTTRQQNKTETNISLGRN